jgi:hypothetical protein
MNRTSSTSVFRVLVPIGSRRGSRRRSHFHLRYNLAQSIFLGWWVKTIIGSSSGLDLSPGQEVSLSDPEPDSVDDSRREPAENSAHCPV